MTFDVRPHEHERMKSNPRDYLIVDENLRRAMRFLATPQAPGEIEDLPGGVAMCSGLEYGVFNIAMMEGPLSRSAGCAERVAETARFFKSRTPRWSFWLCEDHLDAHDLRRSRATLCAISDCGLFRIRPA